MLPWVIRINGIDSIWNTTTGGSAFVYTPEGEFHDMMWALDSDHIFEGVEIVLSAMDSVIKDITENKERIEYGKRLGILLLIRQ